MCRHDYIYNILYTDGITISIFQSMSFANPDTTSYRINVSACVLCIYCTYILLTEVYVLST